MVFKAGKHLWSFSSSPSCEFVFSFINSLSISEIKMKMSEVIIS